MTVCAGRYPPSIIDLIIKKVATNILFLFYMYHSLCSINVVPFCLVPRNDAPSMIVPTRFGLKYAPIPTLALEYEDDLNEVVNGTEDSGTSLYVYREPNDASKAKRVRKLHVVELPMLTRTSETLHITRQLQYANQRFLAPEIVSEEQVKRLLDRLIQNLPDSIPLKHETEARVVPVPTLENRFEEHPTDTSVPDESLDLKNRETLSPLAPPDARDEPVETVVVETQATKEALEENKVTPRVDVSDEEIDSEDLEYFSDDQSDDESF